MNNTKENYESLASVRLRLFVSVILGIIAGSLICIFLGWMYAPLGAWDVAAITFLVWIWLALRGSTPEQTASLALREDPGHAETDVLLILASIASLGAVGLLLVQASGKGEALQIGFGIVSVVISWLLIHTIYMLKYARMYYKNSGGIDFYSQTPPRYSDFAYIAFTIGMTFQVSDNNFKTNEFRKTALRHALLSFLFGTVIVASTVNLIAGLRK
jgi:uncharacterized membrane protein